LARLVFYRGSPHEPSDAVMSLKVPEGRTRIGRTDDCDIVLPNEDISRSHCILDCERGVISLTDRSLNGTFVNGTRIQRHTLKDGEIVRMGPFFMVVDPAVDDSPTEKAQPERRFEELIYAGEGIEVNEAWLAVTRGRDEGRRFRLRRATITVGGPGSDVVVHDEGVVPAHIRLHLIHGRAMVEPGDGPCRVNGVRPRDIYPLLPGDELMIGETALRLEWVATHDDSGTERFGDLCAASPFMRTLFGTLRRVAGHTVQVLIIGDSGTGKELMAKAIHDASPRSSGPFYPVNCGAFAANLVESELFGHEKGSFTGATERKEGAFQKANGGTLFLDEIGELSEDAQAKLLRVLETGEVRRVGGTELMFPDARIVAATNRWLPELVRSGRFRADLYYRLSVIAVRIPPLRERREDIPAVAEAIAAKVRQGTTITPEAMKLLAGYDWPGNGRELRNVITRAVVLSGPIILPEHIIFCPLEEPGRLPSPSKSAAAALKETDREMVVEALRRAEGNKSEAARLLGMARSSLLYRIKLYGIERD